MVRSRVALYCALAVTLFATEQVRANALPAVADPVGARVRGASPQMVKLIQDGVRRSPTFAGLVAALNRSDVIVYVQAQNSLPPGINGHLSVTPGNKRHRYLRIQVLSSLDTIEKIAVVGHELQHAVEVAAHSEVRDEKSLASLYAQIGIEGQRGRYDTTAAQATGVRVRKELG